MYEIGAGFYSSIYCIVHYICKAMMEGKKYLGSLWYRAGVEKGHREDAEGKKGCLSTRGIWFDEQSRTVK
jgi:hypothetical protein